MNDAAFRAWLTDVYVGETGRSLGPQTVANQLWRCQFVERHEGDLDRHFERDGFRSLIERLAYSKDDVAYGRPPRHQIPLKGDLYAYTASLRAAVRYYERFRRNSASATGGSAPPRAQVERVRQTRRGRAEWPVWSTPSESDLLLLAQGVTPFVRYLHPDVVRGIVEDNERHRGEWASELRARGIDPDLYLWERCATVFPGIRRFSGSTELALLRKRVSPESATTPQALRIDDNHYPHQTWSFILRGTSATNRGPVGYSLAHLVDHKAYHSRLRDEFSGDLPELSAVGLPGLFSSAANTVYVPDALIRPTDAAGPLRTLLQRRAAQLYGAFTNLLPPRWKMRHAHAPEWDVDAFEWAAPVGSTEHIATFLQYRAQIVGELLAPPVNTPRP